METLKTKPKIIDVDLALDVKNLVNINKEVKISEELNKKLQCYDDFDLLKVTKLLGSLEIGDIEIVDEELLQKEL
jgi:hypothetical protein